MRVLVVDDQPEATRATCLVLKLLGHDARACGTGAGALSEAESFRPQLALIDLGLPDMSGFELAAALRVTLGSAYLVALTGWDRPEDLARCREAGFDEHVVKPADGETIQRLLAAASR